MSNRVKDAVDLVVTATDILALIKEDRTLDAQDIEELERLCATSLMRLASILHPAIAVSIP
jgi:hypothetical protein